MKKVLLIIGAIVGVIIVRAFFLDPIQEMGWGIFWNGLSEGELMDVEMLFQSKTFLKCVVGAVAGGVIGLLLGSAIQKSTSDEEKENG